MTDELTVAWRAAEADAEVALDAFRTGVDGRNKRFALDTVTEADVEAVLDRAALGDTVVGEEGDVKKIVPREGATWIIDPIDGTNNFARGNRTWATVVARVEDGNPVAAVTSMPATGDSYLAGEDATERDGVTVSVSDRSDPKAAMLAPVFGLRTEYRDEFARSVATAVREFGDVRRFGAGQVSLAAVATGELDAAVSTILLSPWDTVSGVHLVRQAGGRVTDAAGDPWKPWSESLVASNGAIHDDLLAAFSPWDGG